MRAAIRDVLSAWLACSMTAGRLALFPIDSSALLDQMVFVMFAAAVLSEQPIRMLLLSGNIGGVTLYEASCTCRLSSISMCGRATETRSLAYAYLVVLCIVIMYMMYSRESD